MRTGAAAALAASFRSAATWPNAVRSLCPRTVLSAARHRSVHLQPPLSAKSLLYKFTTKSKKKPWYNSPSLTRPDYSPPGLMSLMKVRQKEKRANNPRIKLLNSVLYKALTDLLRTAEVSEEVFDLQIELSKVAVSVDFSVCRAYWFTSGNKETDAKIEMVLQKSAPCFRHLLITHQVLGNVPVIMFLKDKEDERRQKIEDLLATLDFGDNDCTVQSSDISRELHSTSVAELSAPSAPSLFGIDHIDLNKKIAEYKKRLNVKQIENEVPDFSQQQQEQLAEIKRQKLLKKKQKKQRLAEYSKVAQKDYLWASDNDLYSNNQEEYDAELEEEIEDGGSKLN